GDIVKKEKKDTRITRETVYGILYHMNKEGEIERVSTGWYQLPGKERKVTPDPVWQMGYDEGYEKGKADGRQMAMEEEKQWTWEYIEKEVSDRVRQKIQEYLIAKLVQEA